jgi:hypothetical protein
MDTILATYHGMAAVESLINQSDANPMAGIGRRKQDKCLSRRAKERR